ncbi:PREDICTED: RING-H2 [Prunus dulcis]|uniref:RING-type E3 ubiquitin transferase n=1 Tax=Prunus dulcis TaxID=3755 RepID=A0A5E4E6D6_PRUDU|nr:E3 ubiquitin-protein ligase RING1-like [Prunus dulcis]VVA10271.1 PREDICTED: RING-H2 [Prunus dulcis]
MGYKAYTIQSPFSQPPPPPPPPPPPKTNLPMLYYGLIVVGTAATVLAMYNLVFIKWTSNRHGGQAPPSRSSNTLMDANRTRRGRSFENLDSFKYKKKEGSVTQQDGVENYVECAVCLSAFEDGEEVRKLPTCKHSFHAPCIDMWLYSHSDCPLCRAPVPVISWCHRQLTTTPEDNSREVLLV